MQKLWQLLKSKNIFKFGVAAILIAVPLYPKFPLFNVPGTYVAVRVEDFLLAALGLFWLGYLVRQDKDKLLRDKFNQAVLLFLGVGLLSVLSAVFLTKTAAWHLALLHWARRVEYLIPFFLALTSLRFGAKPRFFAETLFIVSFVAFLYGLGQIYAGLPVISTQNEEYAKGIALRWIPGSRLHSTFAGHYDLAAFLVLIFPLMLSYLFVYKKRIERAILFFLVIVPSFWLLLQTGSRISFVAYLIGATVSLWVIKKRLFIAPFLLLSILGMIFLSDLGLRYKNTIETYKERLLMYSPFVVWAQEQEPTPVVRSTDIRFNFEWPRAIRAFKKNPLLGTGYSSITLATDNDYLRLLGEVGLVGFLAFLLVLARLAQGLAGFLRRAKLDANTGFVGGFVGSFAGLLFNAAFIDVFEASKVAIIFWTIAGIVVGATKKYAESD